MYSGRRLLKTCDTHLLCMSYKYLDFDTGRVLKAKTYVQPVTCFPAAHERSDPEVTLVCAHLASAATSLQLLALIWKDWFGLTAEWGLNWMETTLRLLDKT